MDAPFIVEKIQAAEVTGNHKLSVKTTGLFGCPQRHSYYLYGSIEKGKEQVQDLKDQV